MALYFIVSMAAGVYNFTLEQGVTFDKQFTWKDTAGVAINLTGYTARMQIRSTVSSNTTIVDWTSPTQIVLGGAAGTITFNVSATATSAISFPGGSNALPTAVYDLEIVDASGKVTRLLKGTVTLDLEVTR